MPRDLRIWINDRKATTGEEAGKLADSYIHSRQLESKEPSRETNRSSSESEVTRCHYCKKKGHLAKECRKAITDKANESGASKPKAKKKQNQVLQLP